MITAIGITLAEYQMNVAAAIDRENCKLVRWIGARCAAVGRGFRPSCASVDRFQQVNLVLGVGGDRRCVEISIVRIDNQVALCTVSAPYKHRYAECLTSVSGLHKK